MLWQCGGVQRRKHVRIFHGRFPFRQAKSHYRNDFFHPASFGTPGARRHPPIDALQQHRQLRRRQKDRAVLGLGPDEATLFQALREQAKALPVPPQHLDQVTAAATENQQLAAEGILTEMVLGQRREAIETAAQVCMPARQPDMHVRRRRNHPRSPAITARNIATGVSRRIKTLPPDGRTTSIAAAP